MELVKTIPSEVLCIVPRYDGDEKLLNLFISKSEYVIKAFQVEGNSAQNLYVYHCITSKLTGRAAALLSDHQDLVSWDILKGILIQHFGDPRSEECIAMELEGLKIKQGESFIQFCQKIQNIRSSLFAKLNLISDQGVKAAKMIIYNNLAMNVFLFNLPEDMIRIVRLKGCSTLEMALSIVTEEVNFLQQYNAKNNKQKMITPNTPTPLRPTTNGFRPPFGQPVQHNFKFGIPQNQNAFGFRPNFNVMPQNRSAAPQGFRYGTPQYVPQRNVNPNPAQYMRPPFQHGGYKFGIPQQTGFRFGIPNQQLPNSYQHKFGQQQSASKPNYVDTDVSMRTAPVRQNMVTGELFYNEDPYQNNPYYTDNYDVNCYELQTADSAEGFYYPTDSNYQECPDHSANEEVVTPENFQIIASNDTAK